MNLMLLHYFYSINLKKKKALAVLASTGAKSYMHLAQIRNRRIQLEEEEKKVVVGSSISSSLILSCFFYYYIIIYLFTSFFIIISSISYNCYSMM